MSRIGRMPITVPNSVTIDIDEDTVRVKGPKGELSRSVPRQISITREDGVLRVERGSDEPTQRSLHGLTRSLIANMVEGVIKGFEKKLKIEGIGYQARIDKKNLVLTVGYANAIEMTPPEGVTVELPDRTTIVVRGADKQKVGQFAAEVRASRKPEPYKGKGIRYENEQVRRKEGKSFASGG